MTFTAKFRSLSVQLLHLLVGLWTVAGCNVADFGSDSNKAATPEAATTACDAERQYSNLDVKIKNAKDANMLLTGEFCPQAPAALSIVFLVDFSLSMFNKDKARGNDQVVNGSCGRLDAVKAILERHGANIADKNSTIKVGVIQFASDLVGDGIPLTEIGQMSDKETVENFCRGIDGTNYKVALEAAAKMLKTESGRKVVYLISDGLPTEGGDAARGFDPAHRDAAITAIKALRKSIDDLTYNTVFLGDLEVQKEEAGFDPVDFLTELTGDKERVKLVAKAEDLAEEILDIKPPTVDLDLTSAKAVVSADGVEEKDVGFEYFKVNDAKDQVWSFRTKVFGAFPGSDKTSKLTISAEDKHGARYELVYTIGTVAE